MENNNTQSKVEGEKPDFIAMAGYTIDDGFVVKPYHELNQAYATGANRVWTDYVAPLHSRIKELEQEKASSPAGYTIDTNIDSGEQRIIYSDRIKELEAQNAELRENYDGMSTYCNHLTRINVFNMAFDEANDDWRKQHKVEDGESFIHWYMRYHAGHMTDLENDNRKLKARIKELESSQSWVSVKERLPKAPSTVLVWHNNRKTVLRATLYNEGYRSKTYHWSYHDVGGTERLELHETSHWQPLPSKPENK